jgi:hypothetical protein
VWTQAALLAGIAWLTAGPSAQSLGEVARRQSERPPSVGGKKYTNDDLGPAPVAAPVPASTAVASGATPSAAPAAPQDRAASAAAGRDDPSAAPPEAVEKRDEKYWRERAATLQSRIADIRARTKAAEARVKEMDEALANGAGTSHVQERKVALRALEDVQQEGRYMQDEWGRMEARAQAAKTPPEWLK